MQVRQGPKGRLCECGLVDKWQKARIPAAVTEKERLGREWLSLEAAWTIS